MLYFSRWKAIGGPADGAVRLPVRGAEFLPRCMLQSLPKWAQRHLVLGLDLQGGSHILLEVDTAAVRKEKLETLRDDVRRVLRDAKIGYTGLVVARRHRRGPHSRGQRSATGADQAARTLAADRRPSRRHRPAHA